MRLRAWAGARCLLPVLILLTVVHTKADQPRERHYYIAAVEIDWTYNNGTQGSGPTYKKVVFREYEKDFRQAKTHPSWLGILGPTLRAEKGETIVVTFRNMATGTHSIHPHGVSYGKQSEGAPYFDNTSLKEKEDDIVQPNGEHVYYWDVTSDVSPTEDDPTCLTYTYISHQHVVEDYNSGLVGTLLICKPGTLDELGKQIGVHHEYVFLFGVFDEKQSKYEPSSHALDNHVKYTINGYTKGSLPDVSLCVHASVSLHLVGMSSEPEIFSVHMNGQVLQQSGHKVSSVGLISGSTASASMVAVHPGRWLLSSHTSKHMEAGMHGFVDVEMCSDFEMPRRRMTFKQRKESREWTYYIAAEEIEWDYAPSMHDYIDEDFKLQYLRQSPTRIGQKYKKAVYTLYKNEFFAERMETKQRRNELGILGPVIRAQIRDVIKIVFKNMASRPYSIYPHGLTIEKSEEGVNYPEGGNQTHGVKPGETHTYVWRVVEEDEPLDGDSQCLTRMYHSAVDTPRDIASGLIGPMLICKTQSLNVRNVQLKADKEQHAAFAVFDENKSWYLDDNMDKYCDQVNKTDPEFHKSNIMHTINGYAFESGPLLGFCNGEIATWHVSSIGAQDYIQTATFYGHAFELNDRTEDFLNLYPMTGETITMNMDNIGVWLLASLNSHETTKGMRVKFQDVECYRDYQYEYGDYEDKPAAEFTVWIPPTLEEIKKEVTPKPVKMGETEIDIYTDMFAQELGLRSQKNHSTHSDVDKLDLSFLDDDVIDVPDGETIISNSWISKQNTMKNDKVFLTGKDVDAVNLTVVSFQSQSIDGNATHIHNRSEASIMSNSNIQTENTTVLYSPTVSLKNNSSTTNSSTFQGDSYPHNDTVFGTKTTIAHNATASSVAGNISTAIPYLTLTLQEATNLTRALSGNGSSLLETEIINVTLSGANQTSVGTILDKEDEITRRGDVFTYSIPPPNSSTTTPQSTPDANESVSTLSHRKNENNTAPDHLNLSAKATNHSLSSAEVGLVKNLALLEIEVEKNINKTMDKESLGAVAEQEEKLQNATDIFRDPKDSPNSTWVTISKHRGNFTHLLSVLNNTSSAGIMVSNETMEVHNLSLSRGLDNTEGFEGFSRSESSEEVYIYLKENNTEVIKTNSFKPQGQNWTYEGTHQTVPMDIPEHMIKYLVEETHQTQPAPKKKTKIVNLRQWPENGEGMKTKRRKEYKPLARSALPFSPRGLNPNMTPRGPRLGMPQLVSDKEELINLPVVIGVPRPDFSDYEMYVPRDEPDHLGLQDQDVKAEEYEYVTFKDPYSSTEDMKNLNLDDTTKYYLKFSGPNVRTYFIAAEEVKWDYNGYGQRRQDKAQYYTRKTTFTKVVFRGYTDSSFNTPDIRGEVDEHLGILGPVIKAEVGQTIMVVFRNNAKRPYSVHPNGVSYTKQTEGLSYEDGSKYWYKYDNKVQPNTTMTYVWKVDTKVGPSTNESDCRTWAYYSGVNPEKDINSGLIGPLLVCRKGTLNSTLPDVREFMLLFMTFDESLSWYFENDLKMGQRKSSRRGLDPSFQENFKFHSINGIIFNLKGLRMYTNKLVRWHLINMGSPKDYQSVHFHGQTFVHKKTTNFRQAVYPLLPGGFATLEMYPSKPGLWQLETEISFNQNKGMQTLFLVLDDECYRPLGLQSGSVKDSHITGIKTRRYWEPYLARLNNQGQYNAWSTEENNSWIQVDFQRPVVVSQVATQGAKRMFQSHYVVKYYISYSNDRRKWIFYKGDSSDLRKVFPGNQEAYETKTNVFFPPLVGRFIRLHPINWYNKATVRMEFYGCELDGCSVPLGIESGFIEDKHITASSTASSWYSGPWTPSLARLNRQGAVNAWQAKYNNMDQWLQVEMPQIKKITGIITQGAKSFGKEMYVISYTLQYSDNGVDWTHYTDDQELLYKTFSGNIDNNNHVKNYIYPPIFSRFIRIIPRSWMSTITMRIELLGCDFE